MNQTPPRPGPPNLPQLEAWTPLVTAERVFSPEDCAAVVALAEPAKAAGLGDGSAGPSDAAAWRRSTVSWIRPAAETRWVFERCIGVVAQANQRAWRAELAGFTEPLQVARYRPGEHYDWHLDMGAGKFSIRKLSFIVQLSDPAGYEGGAVEFSYAREAAAAARGQGTMVLFPSFLLHRVAAVTAGERHSLVGWIGGPPWR